MTTAQRPHHTSGSAEELGLVDTEEALRRLLEDKKDGW